MPNNDLIALIACLIPSTLILVLVLLD